MGKRTLLPFLILLILFPSIAGADLSDFYRDFSSLGDNSLFYDPNTGRSSFTTLLIPFGGKYEGMGSAYTASADDISYLEANPAGGGRLMYSQLSLMHNDWIADTNIESAAFTFRREAFAFGLGGKFLYLPFTAYNAWGDRDGSGYYSEAVTYANISYTFFRSYGFEGISAGATLKGAFRSVPESIASGQSGMAALLDLGLMTSFSFLKPYASREDNFFLGSAVRNVGIATSGDDLPANASLGLAWSPLRPLLLSFDYTFPFSLTIPSDQWEKSWIAVGADITFTDTFSLQTGFTHRGANPRFSLGGAVDVNDMLIVANYTLDMTTQLTSADRFSVQATMNLGDDGRIERAKRIDEYFIAGLESYANGNLVRAIEYWEAVLEIEPTHRPAEEYLRVAIKSAELQEEMRELNKVE
jgi:hypothetical protein